MIGIWGLFVCIVFYDRPYVWHWRPLSNWHFDFFFRRRPPSSLFTSSRKWWRARSTGVSIAAGWRLVQHAFRFSSPRLEWTESQPFSEDFGVHQSRKEHQFHQPFAKFAFSDSVFGRFLYPSIWFWIWICSAATRVMIRPISSSKPGVALHRMSAWWIWTSSRTACDASVASMRTISTDWEIWAVRKLSKKKRERRAGSGGWTGAERGDLVFRSATAGALRSDKINAAVDFVHMLRAWFMRSNGPGPLQNFT